MRTATSGVVERSFRGRDDVRKPSSGRKKASELALAPAADL
jgi:hypothetical protein